MESEFKVCSRCFRNLRICVSDDIVFYFHWVGDYFLIDVLLYVEGYTCYRPLHQEAYILESAYRKRLLNK